MSIVELLLLLSLTISFDFALQSFVYGSDVYQITLCLMRGAKSARDRARPQELRNQIKVEKIALYLR